MSPKNWGILLACLGLAAVLAASLTSAQQPERPRRPIRRHQPERPDLGRFRR